MQALCGVLAPTHDMKRGADRAEGACTSPTLEQPKGNREVGALLESSACVEVGSLAPRSGAHGVSDLRSEATGVEALRGKVEEADDV